MDWAQRPSEGSEKEQGTRKWLEWRGKGIGSSDAAVLLGLSPWKDIVELWEEKLGISTPEFSEFQLSAMDRGKRLEPKIREWYEKKTGLLFPDDIAEHPEYPYMRASFDGRNIPHGRVLEIKAPNNKDHALAISGVVPDKYYPQCQWLMMVGGHSVCNYVSYGTDDTYAVVNVLADKQIQDELFVRAKEFWRCIQDKIQPNLLFFTKWNSTPVVIDEDIDSTAQKVIQFTNQISTLEAMLVLAKEALKERLGDKEKIECTNAIFGWQKRKGAINYEAIPELKTVNLEAYRKPEIRAFFFKVKNERTKGTDNKT